MTIYVKCDKCGTTEKFRDEHYLPFGWHTEYWDDVIAMYTRERHICDKCWKKMKEEKE